MALLRGASGGEGARTPAISGCPPARIALGDPSPGHAPGAAAFPVHAVSLWHRCLRLGSLRRLAARLVPGVLFAAAPSGAQSVPIVSRSGIDPRTVFIPFLGGDVTGTYRDTSGVGQKVVANPAYALAEIPGRVSVGAGAQANIDRFYTDFAAIPLSMRAVSSPHAKNSPQVTLNGDALVAAAVSAATTPNANVLPQPPDRPFPARTSRA